MPHKMTLTGKATSPLRSCGDIFSFDMEESGSPVAPKGLPLSKPITYTVFVNKKQLKKAKLDENNVQDRKLIVQGEPTLDISVDECPGEIGLICFQLSVMPAKQQPEAAEPPEAEKALQEVTEAVEQAAAAAIKEEEPKAAQYILPLEDILIPEDFLNTPPHPIKTQALLEYVKQHGHLDEPIWLKKDTLTLVDGYRRYIVAKQLEMSHVPVSYR